MLQQIYFKLIIVSLFSVLIPFFFFIGRFRKLSNNQKLLGVLISFAVIADGTSSILGMVFQKPNLWVMMIYGPLEFFMLALIFWKHLKGLYDKRLYFGVLFAFLAYLITSFFFAEHISNNFVQRALGSILVLTLPISFFIQNLRTTSLTRLETRPIFWICTAVLIYFSGNLFVFGISDYAKDSTSFLYTIWVFHGLLNILHNIFYAIAFWLDDKDVSIDKID